jgi:DNA invertase Pin-like site-specific DNA recombinase
MAKAAIYCRISEDRNGDGEGVRRQEQDCRALCRREGLTVARVFVDDDRSAYNGKPREAFEELLTRLGEFDALVYWKYDRLTRSVVEFFRILGACEQAGVRLVSVIEPFDTSTPMGKGYAAMVASMAEQESVNISTRVRRKQADNAAEGRPHGGQRPFGYSSDGVVLPDEAAAVREARDRVLAEESTLSIVVDWNARGIRPVRGQQWRAHSFKRMVTGAHIAGLRTFRGDVVRAGTWEPIITPEDRDRILAVLDRGWTGPGRPPGYPLSGLLVCHQCGHPLRRAHGRRGPLWRCYSNPGDLVERCGSTSVKVAPVDELVEAALLARVDSGAVHRAIRRSARASKRDDAAKLLADLERQLVQAAEDEANGLTTRREWLTQRKVLVKRIEEARAALPKPEQDLLAGLQGDVHARWDVLPLTQKQAVARAVIDRVVIRPPTQLGNRFDPNRVDIVWRV